MNGLFNNLRGRNRRPARRQIFRLPVVEAGGWGAGVPAHTTTHVAADVRVGGGAA